MATAIQRYGVALRRVDVVGRLYRYQSLEVMPHAIHGRCRAGAAHLYVLRDYRVACVRVGSVRERRLGDCPTRGDILLHQGCTLHEIDTSLDELRDSLDDQRESLC